MGLKLTNIKDMDFEAFMKLPAVDDENKSEYIHKINAEKQAHALNIKQVKDKLLEENVFNEIMEISLGTNLPSNIKNKIMSLIENV
jgi:hypothetical protein